VLPAAAVSPAVLAEIDGASQEMPEDPTPPAMRKAYAEDPLASATALLREGRGFEALPLLSKAIDNGMLERTADLAQELSLYRLYLARAVANLTASVGSVNGARLDLALAAYLRRGAAAPRLLSTLLEVADQRQVRPVLERMRREFIDSPAEERLVMGALLRALAGLEPRPAANLMPLHFDHADRRAIYDLGVRLCPDSTEPAALGLDAVLAATAKAALQRTENTANLQPVLESGRQILRTSVHPEAPLQCWLAVFHLLDPVPTGPPVDPAGRELLPALQLSGWARLLELSPPERLLRTLLPRFETLRSAQANLPGMTGVAARIHGLLATEQHAELAARWVAEAVGDPDALLCRMKSLLQKVRIDAAMDDAMAAVQLCADPKAAGAAVARAFRERAATLAGSAEAQHRQRLETLAQAFAEAGS
jgi:hypothetical protein